MGLYTSPIGAFLGERIVEDELGRYLFSYKGNEEKD